MKVASVKNFMMVCSKEDADQSYAYLQFGRTAEKGNPGENVFTMDYKFPMTAVQAFGICISSFDDKIMCA